MRRRLFQWFTLVLLGVCLWTAYANVLSDDAHVRAMARAVVNDAAGCGEGCKLQGLRGERGMFGTRIEYDVQGHGHYVVTCRRELVIAGDHRCVLTEGTTGAASKP